VRIVRPKSIRRLILVGFALVAVPLVAALLFATFSVDRLVAQGQHALFEMVRATQSNQLLAETITDMERSARQYLVVGEPALLGVYREKHGQFKDIVRRLSQINLSPLQRERLVRLQQTEQEISGVLETVGHDAPEAAAAVERFAELAKVAQKMLIDNRRLVEREVERLDAAGIRVQRIMLALALALVPAALVMAGFFAWLVARPIRQLDQAIRRLGDGDFSRPAFILGPRDLEQLGERLDWMRTRLLEVEQEKARFLRHISHELKTPLTAVRECAELLGEEVVGSLNSQQREIAAILRDNSLQLQKLIEDLLDFNLASSRMSSLQTGRLALHELIESVLADHRVAILARQLVPEVALQPVMMEADADKLRTLVDNLLSNAIKFSPDGGRLGVSLDLEDGQAVIRVEDAGPGIPESERARVFDAFYQGQSAANSHVRGTGLGLSIAREYAQAHGGTIEVASPGRAGACLQVRLPLQTERRNVA